MYTYTHTTLQWDNMPISDMKTDHLRNTIKLLIKRIEECFTIMEGTNNTNVRHKIFSSSKSISKAQAKQLVVSITETLAHYIFEATIRWQDFSSELQELYQRKDAIEVDPSYLLPKDKEVYWDKKEKEDEERSRTILDDLPF